MPNWTPITSSNVLDALQAPELDALRTAALGDTQGDPITAAINGVTPRIRGYVASRPGNKLDQDDTLIPPELFQDGVWLVIQALKVRLGDATKLSDNQSALITRAEDDLQKVATGVLRVSVPQNPQTTSTIQSGGGAEIVSSRTRMFGDLSGYTGPTQLNTLAGLGITDGISKNDHWLNPDWLVSFSWLKLIDRPVNVASSGLTDAVSTAALSVALSAAIASAVAGAPVQSVAGRTGNVTLGVGDVSGALAASTAASTYAAKATTLAGYGITDAITAATAASTYAAKATTLAGYGITDAITAATAASTYAAKATTLAGYGITDSITAATASSTYATKSNPSLSGALSLSGGTVTVSTPLESLTQTWNAGAVAFTGWLLNVTDLASAAGSLLLDLQVGGVSKTSVRKDGIFTVFGGVSTAGSFSLSSTGGTVTVAANGNLILNSAAGANGIVAQYGGANKWQIASPHISPMTDASFDIGLSTSTFRVRNGYFSNSVKITGAGAAFEVWNTDAAVSTTNYEKLVIDWVQSANVASIMTLAGGTGSVRALRFGVNGVARWGLDANGHFGAVQQRDFYMQPGATNMTLGFIYMPSGAGAPSGTPANAATFTGTSPTYIDIANGRFYAYYGGGWHYTTMT